MRLLLRKQSLPRKQIKQMFIATQNPAIDMLNIGGVDEVTSIAIYNMYGKKLIENINSSFINVDSLPKGMYMVRINGNKTLTFIKK